MTPEQTFHWLLLQRLPGLVPSTLRRLALTSPDTPDPRHWLEWPARRLAAAGFSEEALTAVQDWRRRGAACATAVAAQRDLEWLAGQSAQLISITLSGS